MVNRDEGLYNLSCLALQAASAKERFNDFTHILSTANLQTQISKISGRLTVNQDEGQGLS